jgi:hypothetical protein
VAIAREGKAREAGEKGARRKETEYIIAREKVARKKAVRTVEKKIKKI